MGAMLLVTINPMGIVFVTKINGDIGEEIDTTDCAVRVLHAMQEHGFAVQQMLVVDLAWTSSTVPRHACRADGRAGFVAIGYRKDRRGGSVRCENGSATLVRKTTKGVRRAYENRAAERCGAGAG
jgi:hypothetical protein